MENKVAHGKRLDMHLNGNRGIVTLARHEICDIVKTMWEMIDHGKISQKGYEQTGPGLPLEGPIRRDQIYKDLRPVLDEIDPAIGLEEVGVQLREEAKRFVAAGWQSKWSSWHHVYRLIEEHDNEDDPLPEGLEAFGYDWNVGGDDSSTDDDDDADDADNDDDDDRPGGGGHGDGGGAAGAGPGGDGDGAGDGNGGDGAGDGDGGGPGDQAASAGGGEADLEVVRAREVLIRDAKSRKDDVLLRRLLAQRDTTRKSAVDAATEAAQVLRKRALAEQAERAEKVKLAKKEGMAAKTNQALTVIYLYIRIYIYIYTYI